MRTCVFNKIRYIVFLCLLSCPSSTRKRRWPSITWGRRTTESTSVMRRIKWDTPRTIYTWTLHHRRTSPAIWRSITSRTIRSCWFGSAVSTAACPRPIKYDGGRLWITRIAITIWTFRPANIRPPYPACLSELITYLAWKLSTRRGTAVSCRTSSKSRRFVSRNKMP